jgi:hypothetical protein
VTTYFLRLRSARVIGSIALDVRSLTAAKSLALEWAKSLEPFREDHPRKIWTVEITNERGETQWAL